MSIMLAHTMSVRGVLLIVSLCASFGVISTQLSAFKELQQIDDEISLYVTQHFIDAVINQDGLDEMEREALLNMEVGGSVQEGSMTARVFQHSGLSSHSEDMGWELQTDLEYHLMDILPSERDVVVDIVGREGFVKVRMTKEMLGQAKLGSKLDRNDYESVLSKVTKNGVLVPSKLETEAWERINIRDRNEEIKLVLAASLNVDIDRITLQRPPIGQRGPRDLMSSYINIILDGQQKLKLSWNIQPVIKLNWWPEVASEWLNRERKWPDNDIVSEVARNVYITTSMMNTDGIVNEESTEMMYSFSNVEKDLASKRSPQQALVYLIFKSIAYRYIIPIDPQHITTYPMKTVMMWTCEKYPPTHPMWVETIPALTVLLKELLNAMKESKLPNYFLPNINVIENIKEDVRGKVVSQVADMLENIDQIIPSNVLEAVTTCRETLNMLKATYKVLDDVRKEYYDIFLKRPDLIPKAIEIFGTRMWTFGKEKKEQLEDVKESVNEKWNQFQEDLDVVKQGVKEKYEEVKEQWNLHDLEKKAKDFMRKFEL